MFRNYIISALRNLLKSKATAFINITGLAIGMACCIMIVLFIHHEVSYDRFHPDSERTFRVLTIDKALGISSSMVGITMPRMGPAMKETIPEVVESVRLNGNGRSLIRYEDRSIYAEDVMYAEPSVFKVFNFPLQVGDTATVLQTPFTAVLSEETARRVFGDEDPIGKTINVDNDSDWEIVGIMDEIPENSHLQLEILLAMQPSAQDTNLAQYLDSWGSISMVTYVQLDDAASETAVESRLEPLIRENNVGENFNVTLQPLHDAHLASSDILFDNHNQRKGDLNYVYSLLAVAVFVILIAAFNFMNLSTARSINRAREVGMRKVIGARRSQLVAQYLGESVILCLLSLAVALILVEAFGGMLNMPIEGSIVLHIFSDPVFAGSILCGTLLLGLFAGSYPALVLSGFKPIAVLKGAFRTSNSGIWLRRVLVTVQFTASIIMIIGTLVVFQQLQYIRGKNIGFDREQILTVSLTDQDLRNNLEAFQNALSQNPSVLGTATSSTMPGRGFGRTGIQPEGYAENDVWIVSIMSFDENYLPSMKMAMADGRNYSQEFPGDQQQSILINEAAAEALGWEDPLTKTIQLGNNTRNVVGVVKNFHFTNMRHKIEPLIMMYQPGANGTFSIRLKPGNIVETMDFIKTTWAEINPNHPFSYTFLDEEFEQLYRSEENFAGLMFNFASLAIFIACLGLFGLAAFTMEQRTKEIGVRKVLGASIGNIILLLSKEFVQLVMIASVVAIPLAYFFMGGWLADFAYRIDLTIWVFILAAAAAMAIALLTVGYQALKASSKNPVEALRYE